MFYITLTRLPYISANIIAPYPSCLLYHFFLIAPAPSKYRYQSQPNLNPNPKASPDRNHRGWSSSPLLLTVDSHIQRIVLATVTEETTVTQQVSHRPIKCQSRLWSQRGTKVNESYHDDNTLFKPGGIQIACHPLSRGTASLLLRTPWCYI